MSDERFSNGRAELMGVWSFGVHALSPEQRGGKGIGANRTGPRKELVYMEWLAIDDRPAEAEANANLVQ